jgi:hypothetical protein
MRAPPLARIADEGSAMLTICVSQIDGTRAFPFPPCVPTNAFAFAVGRPGWGVAQTHRIKGLYLNLMGQCDPPP